MTRAEAVRIVREQTIPALRASGGSGHVDALGVLPSSTQWVDSLITAGDALCLHAEAWPDRDTPALIAAWSTVTAPMRP